MPLLVLGAAVIALFFVGRAVLAPRAVTEKDVNDVTAHALIAEKDSKMLRALQYALSQAGRFPLATAVMYRAQALEAAPIREIIKTTTESKAYVPVQGPQIQGPPAPKIGGVMAHHL